MARCASPMFAYAPPRLLSALPSPRRSPTCCIICSAFSSEITNLACNSQSLLEVLDAVTGVPHIHVGSTEIAQCSGFSIGVANLACNGQPFLIVLDGVYGLPEVCIESTQAA